MQSRPTSREVAGRLLALKAVVTHALAAPPRDVIEEKMRQWSSPSRELYIQEAEIASRQYWDAVNASPVGDFLSPWEREFSKTTSVTMSRQDQLDAMWRAESAQVLLWALRLIPSLPSVDTQEKVDFKTALSDPEALLNGADLLPDKVIDHARDAAELWHWRSRTEQLIRDKHPFPIDSEEMKKGGFTSFQDIVRVAARAAHKNGDIPAVFADDFPVKGKAYAMLTQQEWSEITSITIERHRALNWLCGHSPGNDWDKTPTET